MTDKPKLLIVADTYYPNIDGVLIFMEEFIKRAKNNFEISLLVPKLSRKHFFKDIETIMLDTSKILRMATYPSIELSFKNIRIIKKTVKESDIIFIQDPALAGLFAIRYARKYKKKKIFFTHQVIWKQFEEVAPFVLRRIVPWLVKKLYIRTLNKCDLVLVPYLELKNGLKQEGVKSKMEVAHLGVDIERFSPTNNKTVAKNKFNLPNKTIIGYVGRVSREKNTMILLEAFKKLKEEAHLLIVGDGRENLVEKLKKIKGCQVTGFVDNVEDYLKAIDIFVMPSLTETTSLATLEAMASGLPVVATKVGFMQKYIIKDHNGIFFPRNSSTLLAMKIEKLIADEELRKKLGHNARKTAAYSFSWERSINRIKRILLQVYM